MMGSDGKISDAPIYFVAVADGGGIPWQISINDCLFPMLNILKLPRIDKNGFYFTKGTQDSTIQRCVFPFDEKDSAPKVFNPFGIFTLFYSCGEINPNESDGEAVYSYIIPSITFDGMMTDESNFR
ncbi:MAG: hypothetical protein LBI69_02940 [Puniceicoccales bacterium]|nr:hypothetical protein [Puniceicoccales bacterium]